MADVQGPEQYKRGGLRGIAHQQDRAEETEGTGSGRMTGQSKGKATGGQERPQVPGGQDGGA